MKILKLEISHSKRFQLTGINHIVYTPKSKFQMILGTNGCGKTSLMEEASPLPADLNKTHKKVDGAGKRVTYTNYVLTSGMEYGKKHSFMYLGNELNQGGTMAVQTKLVEEHFGITQQIHDMLTNKTSFSAFSTTERKNWLTMVDKLDYTYALEEFNKQKTALRDVKGALKIAVTRATASDERLSLQERESLELKMYKLEESIKMVEEDISKFGNFGDLSTDSSRRNLSESNQRLEALSEDVLRDDLNMETIVNQFNLLSEKRESIRVVLNGLNSELDTAKEYENIVKTDIDELNSDLEDVVKEIDELNLLNTFNTDPTRIYDDVKGIAIIQADILVLLDKLEEFHAINEMGEDEVDKHRTDIDNIEKRINQYKGNIIQNETRIAYIKEHQHDEDVVCPACTNTFSLTTETSTIEELEEDVRRDTGFMGNSNETLQMLRRFEDDVIERDALVQKISNTLTQSQYRPYIYTMNEDTEYDIISKSEPLIIGLMKIQRTMEQFGTYGDLIKERDTLLTKIEVVRDSESKASKLDFRPREASIIEVEIAATEDKQITINRDFNRTRINRDIVSKLYDEVETNRSYRKKYISFLDRTVDSREASALKTILERLNDTLKGHQMSIRDDDKAVMEVRIQEDNITNLTAEMHELELLTDALSPTKGIIGDAIMGFMNTFLNKVNAIISSMWVYDMKVMPCVISKTGTLDYKFPIQIKKLEPLKDIREGSLSIKEIIDLAFRLVSMELLGLNDYPVFLDEFASSMDDGHRSKAFTLLENLGKRHRQIFMISHFVEFYGGINNMDTSVISKDNIVLDDVREYNTVMKLTR